MANESLNSQDFFDLLAINQTTNKQIIKKAYEAKLNSELSQLELFNLKVAYQNCLVFCYEIKEEVSNSELVGEQVLGVEFDKNTN